MKSADSYHWKKIVQTIKESGVHFIYSESEMWGYVSGRKDRVRVDAEWSIEKIKTLLIGINSTQYRR